MRSPPTLPRRRGRLQPDPKCCGPGSDGLTAESNANMGGRSFARPQRRFCGEGGHYLRQSVSCFSSIAKTAPSFTSTFRTTQTRPILSPNFTSWRALTAPARRTSLPQQTVDILRLVEILGGIESDRLNQPG